MMKCTKKTFKSGVENKYLSDIVISYMKRGHFFLDLIMIIFLIIFIADPYNQIFSIVLFFYSLVMIFMILEDVTTLESEYVLNENFSLYWDLLKIALFNLLFAHFVASILFGMSEIDLDSNWLVVAQINNR